MWKRLFLIKETLDVFLSDCREPMLQNNHFLAIQKKDISFVKDQIKF